MTRQLLVETMPVAFQILEEATQKNGGRMKVRGIFAAADEINGNGRVYPESIQDREIEKIKSLIEEKCLYSEADHPEDGKSRIRNTAAMPISIEKKEENSRKLYVGEAVILNTTLGKDLQEIIRAGGKVGVSQRGWGTAEEGQWNGKRADIVQEDYSLKTFDFVIGGSVKGAEVERVTEQMGIINLIEAGPDDRDQQTNQKGGSTEMADIKTIEELKKAYPDLCLKIEEEAASKKETKLKESMQKEWETNVKEVAEGIRKTIEESQKYKDFKTGMEVHKATLVEVAKLVKPYISESDDDDEELEEQMKTIKTELETARGENKSLKEQMEREKTEAKTREDVKKKIEEVTAGKEHGKLLAEALADCKTVEDVGKRLLTEEALISKVAGKKPEDPPKGEGKVTDENKGGELTEQQQRERRVAGLA